MITSSILRLRDECSNSEGSNSRQLEVLIIMENEMHMDRTPWIPYSKASRPKPVPPQCFETTSCGKIGVLRDQVRETTGRVKRNICLRMAEGSWARCSNRRHIDHKAQATTGPCLRTVLCTEVLACTNKMLHRIGVGAPILEANATLSSTLTP